MQPRRFATLVAAFATGVLTAVVSGQPCPAALPAQLESYVTKVVKPTAAQRKAMFAGQPVTKLLDADPSHEVSVFGIIWVKAPTAQYLEAIRNIEEFEKGDNFRVTKKVSSPPRLEDFEQLTLPADDLEDLKSCRVGSCELKLSEASLNRIRKEIDWSNSPRPQELSAELSQGAPAEGGVVHLLARSAIRAEADDPDQPPDDRRRADARGRGLENAVCQPLFLDGDRTARSRARPETRRRLLVRQREPQPIGRPERIRGQVDSGEGPQRG